jgi:hypothetical protein
MGKAGLRRFRISDFGIRISSMAQRWSLVNAGASTFGILVNERMKKSEIRNPHSEILYGD